MWACRKFRIIKQKFVSFVFLRLLNVFIHQIRFIIECSRKKKNIILSFTVRCRRNYVPNDDNTYYLKIYYQDQINVHYNDNINMLIIIDSNFKLLIIDNKRGIFGLKCYNLAVSVDQCELSCNLISINRIYHVFPSICKNLLQNEKCINQIMVETSDGWSIYDNRARICTFVFYLVFLV